MGVLSFLGTALGAVNGILFTASGFVNDGVSAGMATGFLLSFTFSFILLCMLWIRLRTQKKKPGRYGPGCNAEVGSLLLALERGPEDPAGRIGDLVPDVRVGSDGVGVRGHLQDLDDVTLGEPSHHLPVHLVG